LWAELHPVLEGLGETYEVVFVDDGSTDGSRAFLSDLHGQDHHVRVVRFVRNFGQQMANTAGLHFARGRAVVLMDADLQSPARYIPDLLAKLREGYDLVYGKRVKLTGPLYRRIGTRIANWLIVKMTGADMPDSSSGFLALDEGLVRNVNHYQERSRYLSGLFAWLSYGRSTWIPVERRPRKHGDSKYSFFSLAAIVLTFIARFSTRPLHLALWAGSAVITIAALLGLLWIVLFVTQGWAVSQTALLASVILFSNGLVLIALGVMGDYVGRIYGEVREQPAYLVAEVLEQDGGE
jgi:dolichol-phosphate mannosyltransferase